MTKNNTKQTSSNDEEFLDSPITEESTQSENEQETLNLKDNDVTLDNETNITQTEKETKIATLSNSTSTQKYKVVLSTPTKIVIDVNGNGASYSPTQFTKTLTIGDFAELPPSEEGE